MSSSLQKYLLAPPAPNTAAGFIDDNFAVVDLRRSRHGFSLASSAVTQLPTGLVTPSFDSENIEDPQELAEIIVRRQSGGTRRQKAMGRCAPEGAARTLVSALKHTGNRRELNELFRGNRARTPRRLPSCAPCASAGSGCGQERYLVTVAAGLISHYDPYLCPGWKQDCSCRDTSAKSAGWCG